MEDSELCDTLVKYSTKVFSVEHGGFMSNHISHGIVALARLGASSERVEQFVRWYSKRLETPEQNPREISLPEEQTEEGFNYDSLLGKRIAFYPLLEHYRRSFQAECNESMESLISKHLPVMVDGISSAALHPLIQIGYGYNTRCPEIVLEGLAYLHHSYLQIPIPKNSNFGKGSTDVLDVLEEIRQDKKLSNFNQKDFEQVNGLQLDMSKSVFSMRMAVVAHCRSDHLVSSANCIKVPQWFKLSDASFDDVMKLCDWVIDSAVAVYTGAEKRNEFFLLHGVTGGWSLKQALSAMKGTEVQVLVKCIQEFVYVLCAVYIVEGSPKIIQSYLSQSVEESWEEIIQQAIDSEIDEHVYKLVQICYERASTYPADQQDLFKAAALSCMNFTFSFQEELC